METRRLLLFLAFGLISFFGALAPAAAASRDIASNPNGDKALVMDGHAVLDAGRLWIHVSNWDGRDDRGNAVASGAYVVAVETAESRPAAVKITLLR